VFSTEARTAFLLAEGFVSCAIDSDDKTRRVVLNILHSYIGILVKVLFDIGF
jgi:hypothetical protein